VTSTLGITQTRSAKLGAALRERLARHGFGHSRAGRGPGRHVVEASREISDVVRAVSETSGAQAGLRMQRQLAYLTWF
jgi:hypothetical protein